MCYSWDHFTSFSERDWVANGQGLTLMMWYCRSMLVPSYKLTWTPPLPSSPLPSSWRSGEGEEGSGRWGEEEFRANPRADLRKQLHFTRTCTCTFKLISAKLQCYRTEIHEIPLHHLTYLDPLRVILDSHGSDIATPKCTRVKFASARVKFMLKAKVCKREL